MDGERDTTPVDKPNLSEISSSTVSDRIKINLLVNGGL